MNMLPFLRSAGFEPVILFAPDTPTETPELSGIAEQATATQCEIVVFQKIRGPSALESVRALRLAGVRTLFAVCDMVDVQMAHETDVTVVVTDYLKSLYPASLHARIHVVHDGIERPEVRKDRWTSNSRDSVSAVLVTSAELNHLPLLTRPPAWLSVNIVGRYAGSMHRFREIWWKWTALRASGKVDYLRFLGNRRIHCIPWDPEGVYREMEQADIAIIPIETPPHAQGELELGWKVKSENRLTMKMSVGLPVIATPIPSYEDVIDHGRNGFLARSRRDWDTCLDALRDPQRRREMGLAARASVIDRYSMQNQAEKLMAAMERTRPR